ncbi:uncharacterized protein LOC132201892 [Neocloeon triangulifer]|uniref:uncharacterized protein LOC132201892 n=1 Tax=Neocloeon triangulifer TaxID=2078957 RepID=UPI00286F2C3C|nr:uncharacterized protein LOC132201892 [Neocloeon triangulifer]
MAHARNSFVFSGENASGQQGPINGFGRNNFVSGAVWKSGKHRPDQEAIDLARPTPEVVRRAGHLNTSKMDYAGAVDVEEKIAQDLESTSACSSPYLVESLFEFQAGSDPNSLSFQKGNNLLILHEINTIWSFACDEKGKTGRIPNGFVKRLAEKTDLQNDETLELHGAELATRLRRLESDIEFIRRDLFVKTVEIRELLRMRSTLNKDFESVKSISAPPSPTPPKKSQAIITYKVPKNTYFKVEVLMNFKGGQAEHLPLNVGDIVFVFDASDPFWWHGESINGLGKFPSVFVVPSPIGKGK